MSEKRFRWPDNWVKLTCPNGHELQSYSTVSGDRVYGFCDVCKVPYAWGNIPVNEVPPRMMIPSDENETVDYPPFDFPPMTKPEGE